MFSMQILLVFVLFSQKKNILNLGMRFKTHWFHENHFRNILVGSYECLKEYIDILYMGKTSLNN